MRRALLGFVTGSALTALAFLIPSEAPQGPSSEMTENTLSTPNPQEDGGRTMLAFEVSLNGEVLYVAGFSEGLSLMTTVRAFRFPPSVQQSDLVNMSLTTVIPGSTDGPSEPIQWGGQRGLSVGDAVTVRIVEVDQISEPDDPEENPIAIIRSIP